jgi:hypothetical protein
MASCVIANMRDSWSGSPVGAMQAASAALAAVAFQAVTALPAGFGDDAGALTGNATMAADTARPSSLIDFRFMASAFLLALAKARESVGRPRTLWA